MNLRKKFSGQYALLCIFAFFIIFTLVIGAIVQLQNIRDYKEKKMPLEYELSTTEKQLENIKSNKSYKNDAELEDLARNQLGMVKENEIIYLEK